MNELEDAIKEVFGMKRIVEQKVAAPSGKTPKAYLLFIEPSIQMYSFTSALFDNPIFCTGLYEKKVLYVGIDNLSGIILTELATLKPDIVLINDYAMSEGDLLNMIDLIRSVKLQPDDIIIHGLFERSPMFETHLKMKKVKRCIQNVMAHDQLIQMNEKLIHCVDNVCIEHGLLEK